VLGGKGRVEQHGRLDLQATAQVPGGQQQDVVGVILVGVGVVVAADVVHGRVQLLLSHPRRAVEEEVLQQVRGPGEVLLLEGRAGAHDGSGADHRHGTPLDEGHPEAVGEDRLEVALRRRGLACGADENGRGGQRESGEGQQHGPASLLEHPKMIDGYGSERESARSTWASRSTAIFKEGSSSTARVSPSLNSFPSRAAAATAGRALGTRSGTLQSVGQFRSCPHNSQSSRVWNRSPVLRIWNRSGPRLVHSVGRA